MVRKQHPKTTWLASAVLVSATVFAQNDAEPPPPPPPPAETTPPPPMPMEAVPNGAPSTTGTTTSNGNADTTTGTQATTPPPMPPKDQPVADAVPPGQELVNIDFPEPTEIKDIIRAVALWTGKNVILGKGVSGKVQMISPRKVTKEEAYQMFLSALNVLGLTTVETGKVIKILPVRNAVQGNLQIYQGSSWAPLTDKMITQIVPLKYIDAKQIQATLSRIVSTNSMIAYQPTNTLIISDTGYKVRRILAIIELLDVQGQQPQVALVPIKYADAKNIASKVQQILSASAGTGGKAGVSGFKIDADERSNSVVIFGPPRTIADVKALVRKFDFPVDDPTNQSTIRVRFLDYADAKKLATTLSSLAQSGSTQQRTRSLGRPLSVPAPNTTGGARRGAATQPVESPVADLGDNVKITADESSNALLITGSRASYNAINALIRKLDRRRAQVYVEADILDLINTGGFEFGTSIFAGSGKANGTKMAYGWNGASMGSILAAQRDPDSDSAAAAAIGAFGAENLTIGVLSGASVTVPGIGKVSPGALINLLKTDGNTRVLSSPHLLASNNEKAKIVVGKKLFYKTAVQSSVPTQGALEKVDKEDVDLTLEIKPNVSSSGNYVTMELNLEGNEGTITPQQLPDVNKRQTQQIVTVRNGQTTVISGLVKMRESERFVKIPFLGDIPILGWLFRNSKLEKEESTLMIFLTPHIDYGPNDLAAIYESKIKERDEIMAKAFDTDPDHPFMAKLPTLEDGKFKPNEYDEMDQRNQEQFIKDLREDMGYNQPMGQVPAPQGAGAPAPDEDVPINGSGDPVTVPVAPFDDGGGAAIGGDTGANDMPPPMGGDEPPPPPPPPPDDFGGGGDMGGE